MHRHINGTYGHFIPSQVTCSASSLLLDHSMHGPIQLFHEMHKPKGINTIHWPENRHDVANNVIWQLSCGPLDGMAPLLSLLICSGKCAYKGCMCLCNGGGAQVVTMCKKICGTKEWGYGQNGHLEEYESLVNKWNWVGGWFKTGTFWYVMLPIHTTMMPLNVLFKAPQS